MDNQADVEALANALIALDTAAREFALYAARGLAKANPAQHERLMDAFANGYMDLRTTIVHDKPPHVRLTHHVGDTVHVLFDTDRGLPPPQVGG